MTTHRTTALIIDDSAAHAAMLDEALRPHVDVITAGDGLDGYHLACARQPDVVLLDILMPVIDGWTVCRKLRANPATAHIPIIVITALEREVTEPSAARLDIARVIYRPCTALDVWQAVASVLRLDLT
jgi:two-component system cell cycle response regulator